MKYKFQELIKCLIVVGRLIMENLRCFYLRSLPLAELLSPNAFFKHV